MRAPAALRRALSIAYAGTETKDAIDALFDALPKEIRDSVPKTGRTMRGAMIGEGRAYASVNDKARHLFKHWDKLDLEQAAKNLLLNHVTDEVLGRLFGNADNWHNRNTGGARVLNI